MQRKLSVLVLTTLAAWSAVFAGGQEAEIAVRVEGARGNKGWVRVALFGKAGFPEDEKQALRGDRIAAAETNRVVRFAGVPFGDYAVLAYHDENADDRLDKGLFGVPKEGWAVSNNVRPNRRPPNFDESKISVTQTIVECVVRLGY
jgi:uncharacterized protein (DUF2141 family)